MKKPHVFIGAAVLLLLGAACGANNNTNSEENDNANVVQKTNTTTNTSSNTNTDDGPVATDGSLTILIPEKDAEVESPFVVRGKSEAEVVYVRLERTDGTEIFTVPVNVRDGEYTVNLTYQLGNTASGVVDVYEKDADGNETRSVSVTVKFPVEEDTSSNSNTNSSDTGDDD